MDNDKRALSWNEFVDSGFDGRDYKFPDFEGTVIVTVVCKRWGNKRNIFAYCDLDDGRKLIASAWSDKNYLGLADLPVGGNAILEFQRISNGRVYLKKVVPVNMK